MATYESGRKTASLADYRKGLAEAQKTFVNLAGSRESGFYNPKKPIGLMYRYKEGKRELFPMKAPAKNILEEKGKYFIDIKTFNYRDVVKTSLTDNLGILQNATVNSLEYAEALGKVRDAMVEAFGINLSANFVEDNLQLIKEMSEGSVEAFKEL